MLRISDDSTAMTDLHRWRLECKQGAHKWRYLSESDALQPSQSFAEKYFLGLPTGAPDLPSPEDFIDTAVNALDFFSKLQLEDGHWACSYGGLSFLLPGLVFAMYITGMDIPSEWKDEITRYISNHVNKDGGWGLHLHGTTTVFATTFYYLVLRILGMSPEHALAEKARARLLALGGAIGLPQWGKYWLACLNLYEWDGVNPVPHELWLCPDWVPFHPWRWWIQCRVVYLPASYLYANKCKMPLNPLLEALREEIYVQPFPSIKFAEHRYTVAPADNKRPHPHILKVIDFSLRVWENHIRPLWLHDRANVAVRHLIQREDGNTFYDNLAPVNKAFTMAVAHFSDGKNDSASTLHQDKMTTYLWQGAKGMTCGGTNGAQVWDTALTIIAVAEAGLATDAKYEKMLEKALGFLEKSQLRDDLTDSSRQPRHGGWPLSTKENGYIVSDCSAESMKAIIMLQEECGFPKTISDSRLEECVNSLLEMQNDDGGFGCYERTRANAILEVLHQDKIFDRVMVEHSNAECTGAVLTSFSIFRRYFPDYRSTDVRKAFVAATSYLIESQRTDGTWCGSWAVSFLYGTFFALEGLGQAGLTWQNSLCVRKACEWLLSKQMTDGGWGEHYTSSEAGEYVAHEKSQVVDTAWAVLSLMSARYPYVDDIERGLHLIKSRQQKNGEWLQEDVEGDFSRNCMIGYPNYKFYFPILALGRFGYEYLPYMIPKEGIRFKED